MPKETKRDKAMREMRERLTKAAVSAAAPLPVDDSPSPPKVAKKRAGASAKADDNAVENHPVAQNLLGSLDLFQTWSNPIEDDADSAQHNSDLIPLPPAESFYYPQRNENEGGSETVPDDQPAELEINSATPSGIESEKIETITNTKFAGFTTPSETENLIFDTEPDLIPLPPAESFHYPQRNENEGGSETENSENINSATGANLRGVAELENSPFHYPQRNGFTGGSGIDRKAPKRPKSIAREIEVLRGLQKAFLYWVMDRIEDAETLRTGKVKLREIAEATGASENTTDYNYGALRRKRLLVRHDYQGALQLEIPKEVFVLLSQKRYAGGQPNDSATPSGMRSTRARTSSSLLLASQTSESDNEPTQPKDLGARKLRSNGHDEDRAPARPETKLTDSRARAWEKPTKVSPYGFVYKWAHRVVIPDNVEKAGVGREQMDDLERSLFADGTAAFDFAGVQSAVVHLSNAIAAGAHLTADQKTRWRTIPGYFMWQMLNLGKYEFKKRNFSTTSDIEEIPF